MYLISACLVGINCRYDATSTLNFKLKDMIGEGKVIAVCPEFLVGLPSPRELCEIQIKDGVKCVIGISGKDYTNLFEKAAIETLKICKRESIQNAILQSRNPSCGYGKIYNGSFKSKLIDGNGYTADLLSKNGIEILKDVKYLRNKD